MKRPRSVHWTLWHKLFHSYRHISTNCSFVDRESYLAQKPSCLSWYILSSENMVIIFNKEHKYTWSCDPLQLLKDLCSSKWCSSTSVHIPKCTTSGNHWTLSVNIKQTMSYRHYTSLTKRHSNVPLEIFCIRVHPWCIIWKRLVSVEHVWQHGCLCYNHSPMLFKNKVKTVPFEYSALNKLCRLKYTACFCFGKSWGNW